MMDGFSESLRQFKDQAYVDTTLRYLRKYWSTKRETITVRVISTEAKNTDTSKFRNEIRAFLYQTPKNLEEMISDIKSDHKSLEYEVQGYIDQELEVPEDLYNDYKLKFRISTQIRAYEKEFFYLKVLKLGEKPQLVLRALALLSQERTLEEVFTAPEFLFELLGIYDARIIVYRKDIRIRM